MSITVHKLYYGPVEENGWLLKSTSEVQSGSLVSSDQILEIYTKEGKGNKQIDDSELLHTSNGPVIRVTRIEPLQGHDSRTMENCNKTLFIRLSDIASLLLPFLDQEMTFPLQEIKLKVTKES